MDMVRFAVVGTSAITARFLDALALEQGAVLHAVYSRTKQRAQAFGAQYGARAYYDSLQALDVYKRQVVFHMPQNENAPAGIGA